MAFSRTCWGSNAFFPAIRPSCVPPCEEYTTCWNEKSRMWEVRFTCSMGEMVQSGEPGCRSRQVWAGRAALPADFVHPEAEPGLRAFSNSNNSQELSEPLASDRT